jgi:hypothetical protein
VTRRLPPVTQLGMAALALLAAAVINLAARIPEKVSLLPSTVLVAAAGVLVVSALTALARAPAFAWDRFVAVARWALVAYATIAGLIAYSFVHNGVRGGTLAVLCGALVVFALDVPTLIAFTVARHAEPTSAR